jgi:hypothetical protein
MANRKSVTLCDYHSDIYKAASEILRIRDKDYEDINDLLSKVQDLADDIYCAVEVCTEMGNKMEDRMREYREAIEGLGFQRVKR